MGCSIGVVTKMLSTIASQVVGIDGNLELIKEAEKTNSASNINYLNLDLTLLDYEHLQPADGIWSSFVASYFPDFDPILDNWVKILKQNGWIAIVEMSDLFSHEPLSKHTQKVFESYSLRQLMSNTYDFTMGNKLESFLNNCGLSILNNQNMYDYELTFNGPADPRILRSWENRFDRMKAFRKYLGNEEFNRIKAEFLTCLSDKNHKSNSIVKFIIAKQ